MIKNDRKYKWDYENIGGTTRVKITKGADIVHLAELDSKMWTVHSCPVQGLEIDAESLAYMDVDGDGKLRVCDVIYTSQWITSVLNNPDLLLGGKDSIDIKEINQDGDLGKKLYLSARQILENSGKGGSVISLSDVVEASAVFASKRFNGDGVITESSTDDTDAKEAIAAAVTSTGGTVDHGGETGVTAGQIESFYKDLADYAAWYAAAVEAPFGDRTDAAIAAYKALDAKVKDYFMRSRLASFSPESVTALDVQITQIEAISAENLFFKTDEIAAYPIVRITGRPELDLTVPVNPAWISQLDILKSAAIPSGKKSLTEEEWVAIGARFTGYDAWRGAKAGASVEGLGIDKVKKFLEQDKKSLLLETASVDQAFAEEAESIELLKRFMYIFRDLYRLLRNFVTFHDFYDKNGTPAIFQSGRLLVDQRECRFCMTVADMSKHGATAASGMYLIYCDCVTKTKPGKLTVVAAMTVGEIGDIFVGKNVVYYDNAGVEWDAVITKIVDNPISISQAFWSPYRRMAAVVENLINKSAAEKDAKIMKETTDKINAAPAVLPAAATADGSKPAPTPPFDIAKFAGIFAAIGMAFGMIGTAVSGLIDSLSGMGWKLILVFIGILLVISGPSMVMAWLKLRRRNIAPLLNANGWAINAASKISIPFGETLTDIARYPVLKLKDPYAKTGLSSFWKWVISLLCLGVVILGLWLGNLLAWTGWNSPLPYYDSDAPVEAVDSMVCTSPILHAE